MTPAAAVLLAKKNKQKQNNVYIGKAATLPKMELRIDQLVQLDVMLK